MTEKQLFQERSIVGAYLDKLKRDELNIGAKKNALNRAFLSALAAQSSIAIGRLEQASVYLDVSLKLFEIAVSSKMKQLAISHAMPVEYVVKEAQFYLIWLKTAEVNNTLLDELIALLNKKTEEELQKTKSNRINMFKYGLVEFMAWKGDFPAVLSLLEQLNNQRYKRKKTPYDRAEFDPYILMELALRFFTGVDSDRETLLSQFSSFFENRTKALDEKDSFKRADMIPVVYLYYKYIKKVPVDPYIVIQSTEWGELEERICRDHIPVTDPICYVK